jgi:hypothetical protein
MDEMMEDTLEAMDDDELEDEADEEVDKVLYELTDGKLGQAGQVGTELPVSYLCALCFPSKTSRESPRFWSDDGVNMKTDRTRRTTGCGDGEGDATYAEGTSGFIDWVKSSQVFPHFFQRIGMFHSLYWR